MSQVYRSTRSSSEETKSFEEAVIQGLAEDGGLFLPAVIPRLTEETLFEHWAHLSFQELALEIMKFYIADWEIPAPELQELIERSYASFRSEEVTPLRKNVTGDEENLHVLELFHGPTYAFKDVALQFVGNLFEYFLERKNRDVPEEERTHLTVVGATSGDTGSAAIYGLRGKQDVSVFILYPNGRISPIQEEQMTTVHDENVHTMAIEGSFDNCQDIVKAIFVDEEFNQKHNIAAVNSINWARILAQITYYFYSYFRATDGQPGRVKFIVPSGNFGDILAGFYAKKMGLPIEKLVIATNENDILDRFLRGGVYERSEDVTSTHSPAMDILISSNFERLLWFFAREQLAQGDDQEAGSIVNGWFEQLREEGRFEVPEELLDAVRYDFDSERVDNYNTLASIRHIYEHAQNPERYVIDPHTAVGICAANRQIANDQDNEIHYISLATAHPAKFADAVNEALSSYEDYNFDDVIPDELRELSDLEKRIKYVDNCDVDVVKSIIEEELINMGIYNP
ncbi:AaceriAAR059Cp [[Ashbya] aceris (nom. inval.)]|nr:AaceriAAR059Cp [[Ashbya] aceris (nom. inval.)]